MGKVTKKLKSEATKCEDCAKPRPTFCASASYKCPHCGESYTATWGDDKCCVACSVKSGICRICQVNNNDYGI